MDHPDEPTAEIALTLNGEPTRARVPLRQSLVDWLRHGQGLTGSHVGCEHGVCGACHVQVDGRVVRGCLMLAVQADGTRVETIEGATETGRIRALQDAFFNRAALQCGFCTPGMLLQAAELLAANPAPSRAEIREALSGNYCRCTGYHAIVDAVEAAAAALRA
ncbi:(2Fe-2S)-binding protein [Roseomonas sp. KE2513]|uniref:(2Fe-2S)-binding protein n=1 Tax=Roseomonas sp. KE2513 TaxID=2479202 RepID=UPI0018DF1984|nr:(2Fe-2S)-binding protein [Roseomonas sp. KE2513]MBI0537948.1 (2Fe-2S)-binding protein [Roseomonas sp. KE2513]